MGVMDLSGLWRLSYSDGVRGELDPLGSAAADMPGWMDARVPGEVHWTLVESGLIGDPALGSNALAARWVEECIWTYRTVFTPPPEALEENASILLEGLDYFAVIYLNGSEIGRHDNFFCPCRLPVSGLLRPGENTLCVRLDSGLFGVAGKPVDEYRTGGEDMLLHKRIWLRKPQCSFEWDWSPRYINVGIHKPVALEWAKSALLEQAAIYTDLDAGLKHGRVAARMLIECFAEAKGKFTVEICEAGLSFGKDIELRVGRQTVEFICEVEDPGLWWPVGQGAQRLYTVRARLAAEGQEALACEKRVGFRHIRIDQSPHPDGGDYFVTVINDRKIFVKGANFVPADVIYARIDGKKYETLVDRALEANFNMLRVWGGGLYESDDFYDFCDEKGILVWQDFTFACAIYPGADDGFLANVKREAAYNIRNLAHHPSLAVWCGNNENEWLYGARENSGALPDYDIYHKILPELLRQEDPSRYYQPSSPYSRDGAFPNADETGDQHPWSIGFDNNDFYGYREMACRFPNEGGILGPTSLRSMRASLDRGQERVFSFSWSLHDNSVALHHKRCPAANTVKFWLDRDMGRMSPEEYAYWGGLLQGEGLKEYIDNFRARKFDTASAIFWMFNDCWPATRSWTIVDYYLNRTPSFHHVRRAFAPVGVSLARKNGAISVIGVSDLPETWKGTLKYGLFTLDGRYLASETKDVEIPRDAAVCLAKLDEDVRGIPFAELYEGETRIAKNRLFTERFHEMGWSAEKPSVRREGNRAVFSAESFIWGVCLDLVGEEALTDNFFDIFPGEEVRIEWPEDGPLPEVKHYGNLIGHGQKQHYESKGERL